MTWYISDTDNGFRRVNLIRIPYFKGNSISIIEPNIESERKETKSVFYSNERMTKGASTSR